MYLYQKTLCRLRVAILEWPRAKERKWWTEEGQDEKSAVSCVTRRATGANESWYLIPTVRENRLRAEDNVTRNHVTLSEYHRALFFFLSTMKTDRKATGKVPKQIAVLLRNSEPLIRKFLERKKLPKLDKFFRAELNAERSFRNLVIDLQREVLQLVAGLGSWENKARTSVEIYDRWGIARVFGKWNRKTRNFLSTLCVPRKIRNYPRA